MLKLGEFERTQIICRFGLDNRQLRNNKLFSGSEIQSFQYADNPIYEYKYIS